MEEIHKLRGQISNIVQANFSDADAGFVPKINPPNAFQACLPVSWGFTLVPLILIIYRLKFSANF